MNEVYLQFLFNIITVYPAKFKKQKGVNISVRVERNNKYLDCFSAQRVSCTITNDRYPNKCVLLSWPRWTFASYPIVKYSQLSRKRSPLVHEKVVGNNQGNKPKTVSIN